MTSIFRRFRTFNALSGYLVWGPHAFNLSFLRGLNRLKLLSISAFSFNTALATAKDADTIGQLPKLTQLSLGGINIENLDFIRALHNLTELNLQSITNKIARPSTGGAIAQEDISIS